MTRRPPTSITLVWTETTRAYKWTAGPYTVTRIALGLYVCTFQYVGDGEHAIQMANARDLATAKRRCRTHAERMARQAVKL